MIDLGEKIKKAIWRINVINVEIARLKKRKLYYEHYLGTLRYEEKQGGKE